MNSKPSNKMVLHRLLVVTMMMGGSVQAQTLAQDCAIASSAWSAMGGRPAISSTNCCSASGVTCSSGRVTSLNWDRKYNSKFLTGSIPSNLGDLTNLQWLDLSKNQLNGSIPSSLGNLANLAFLGLHSNQLTGSIPSELGNLSKLTSLYLYNNQLSGYPSSLDTSRISRLQLFPNPMSSIPYDRVVNVSSILLSTETWIPFLSTPVSLKKRDQTSSSGVVSVNDLLQQCNINNVQQMPAGCIAGIFQKYCTNPSDWALLQQCQSAYDTAFSNSIFSTLGANCPAWKYGPKSSNCGSAVSSFSYKYFVDSANYIQLNSTHATQLVGTIFASTTYAPCNRNFQTCR